MLLVAILAQSILASSDTASNIQNFHGRGMIYDICSALFRSFLRPLDLPTHWPQALDDIDLPQPWRDRVLAELHTDHGRAIWKAAQAMATGRNHSLMMVDSHGAGMLTSRCMTSSCNYCGAVAIKPIDKGPITRAVFSSASPERSYLCSQCESVRYCSSACQRADWKNHCDYCKP